MTNQSIFIHGFCRLVSAIVTLLVTETEKKVFIAE